MPESVKQVAERWFEEVWNQGHRETIDKMLAPDCVLHDPGEDIVGPEGFKRFYDNIQNTFDEVRVNPQFSISEGDYVSVRWVATGKHKDSGKNVEIAGMSLMRFRDGLAVEAWQNWDLHGMMQQVAPERAMSAAAG
ncbi:MAG: nuclear transport factor 2 family protein [Bryobacteraceae bacterium]